ncbi:MAG: hypothetical protein ACJATY_003338 [Spirosomataceae bacterium]|jgi:hypothetical protein
MDKISKNVIIEAFQKQFAYYKRLGEQTIQQLTDKQLFWQASEGSNSITMIVNHVVGNQLSRFTDFLTSDSEKPWRNRDAEFEEILWTKEEVLKHWETGWTCLFTALNPLTENDLNKVVYIRNIGHTVFEALTRQLAHYASHVGQIVFVGKILRGNEWISLSIPKGNSEQYNADKFNKPKVRGHFTDEYLKP